jgi:hypothetical protein
MKDAGGSSSTRMFSRQALETASFSSDSSSEMNLFARQASIHRQEE